MTPTPGDNPFIPCGGRQAPPRAHAVRRAVVFLAARPHAVRRAVVFLAARPTPADGTPRPRAPTPPRGGRPPVPADGIPTGSSWVVTCPACGGIDLIAFNRNYINLLICDARAGASSPAGYGWQGLPRGPPKGGPRKVKGCLRAPGRALSKAPNISRITAPSPAGCQIRAARMR